MTETKPYTTRDVEKFVDDHRTCGFFLDQFDRLRRDPGQRVSWALNRLTGRDPRQVLFCAAKAADIAEDRHSIVAELNKLAKWCNEIGANAAGLAEEIHGFAPLNYRNALLELSEYMEGEALRYKNVPAEAGVSRKIDMENASGRQFIRRMYSEIYRPGETPDEAVLASSLPPRWELEIEPDDRNNYPAWIGQALRDERRSGDFKAKEALANPQKQKRQAICYIIAWRR